MCHVVYKDEPIPLCLQARNIENNLKYNWLLFYNLNIYNKNENTLHLLYL